jgi:hypothetical protein
VLSSALCSSSSSLQAQSDAEALAGALDKDEGRASPCTPSTPSVCSPPSAASSVPSAGKNICSSCGLEILDRYLLKVSQDRLLSVYWRAWVVAHRTVGKKRWWQVRLIPHPGSARCPTAQLWAILRASLSSRFRLESTKSVYFPQSQYYRRK